MIGSDSTGMDITVKSQALPFGRNARPFIKWAGGKKQLLSQLEAYFPKKIKRYFEPFVGGGAVFFHLWNRMRLTDQVFLFDNNEELVNLYCTIRDRLEELIDILSTYKGNHNKDYYYQIRNLDRQPIKLGNVERAARTLYLNRTCYNGLYRVNRKGQFNVPIGRYKNPDILFEKVLRSGHAALQTVCVEARDFRDIVQLAQPGDFFYFDPPFDPLSKTSNFTSYTAESFRDQDQKDLAAVFTRLTEKGCYCMLSNSYTPFILELYQRFRIEIVYAKRAVNSDVNGRGAIKEAVVLNYEGN
jgi:DNA adenine methylase